VFQRPTARLVVATALGLPAAAFVRIQAFRPGVLTPCSSGGALDGGTA
jgi:hypothetical protein